MNKPPERRIAIDLDVAFHDVDALQVVWHGHYYKFFELARTALFRTCKLDVHEMIDLDYRFVVIESKCRHSFPLRYGDRFRVSAWFKDVEYRLHIAFEVENLSAGRRSARGHTMLATLDAAGNLLMGTPRSILDRLSL